jgi:predicted dehydrogenase
MHAAAIKKSAQLDLAAIVHSHKDAGEKAADEYGCVYYGDAETMLTREQPDIVDVCLPTSLHEQYVLLAAKHKKHVVCEKPFALSSEACLRMTEACKQAGVKLMVAQVVRWMPEYLKIKEILDAGSVGDIHMVYSNRLAQHPNWTKWHRDVTISGGGLFDLHLHDIDYLYSLFGEVDTVDAVGWKSPTGCWNHVISTLRFKNSVKAVSEGSLEMVGDFPFSAALRITGDKATVDYRFQAGFNIENLDAASSVLMLCEKGQPAKSLKVEGIDPFQAELEAFALAVENNKAEPILPKDSIYVVKIIEALRDSLETEKIIPVGPSV